MFVLLQLNRFGIVTTPYKSTILRPNNIFIPKCRHHYPIHVNCMPKAILWPSCCCYYKKFQVLLPRYYAFNNKNFFLIFVFNESNTVCIVWMIVTLEILLCNLVKTLKWLLPGKHTLAFFSLKVFFVYRTQDNIMHLKNVLW